MENEDGKKDVKGGTKFGEDGSNHFTDLCSATEKFFSSQRKDQFSLRKSRLNSHVL